MGGNMWAGLSIERQNELREQHSQRQKARWTNMSPEGRKAFSLTMSKVRLSEDLEKKTLRQWKIVNAVKCTRANMSLDRQVAFSQKIRDVHAKRSLKERMKRSQKLSKATLQVWASRTVEEKQARSEKTSLSSRRMWASRTFEELRADGLRKSISQKAAWARLSEDKREAWVQKCLRAQHRKPSGPEKAVKSYLDVRFPGKWTYTGDGKRRRLIGRKTPDFIATDRLAVIEVLGAVGYYHSLLDGVLLPQYYEAFGYKCFIVWEWESYFPSELDRVLGEKESK